MTAKRTARVYMFPVIKPEAYGPLACIPVYLRVFDVHDLVAFRSLPEASPIDQVHG